MISLCHDHGVLTQRAKMDIADVVIIIATEGTDPEGSNPKGTLDDII